MKKILVINGNPKGESLSKSIAMTYYDAAISSGYDVKIFHIDELKFDPNLRMGRDGDQPLEPDFGVWTRLCVNARETAEVVEYCQEAWFKRSLNNRLK